MVSKQDGPREGCVTPGEGRPHAPRLKDQAKEQGRAALGQPSLTTDLKAAFVASLGGSVPPEISLVIDEIIKVRSLLDQVDTAIARMRAPLVDARTGKTSKVLDTRDRLAQQLTDLLAKIETYRTPKPASTPSPLDYLAARRAQERPPQPPTSEPVKAEAMGTRSPTPTLAPVTPTLHEEPEPAAQPELADPPREESMRATTKPRLGRCAPCALVGQRECPHVGLPEPAAPDPGPKIVSPPDHQLGLPPGTIDKLIETASKTGRVKGLIQLRRRRDLDDDPEFARQRRFSPPLVINLAGNPFGRRA